MTRLVSAGIARLRPYVAGKPLEELARELGIADAVKLASNENPLGASPKALAAAKAAVEQVHRYPDANAFDLRARLSRQLGVAPGELVFGNGSNELLDLLVRTFVVPGQEIVFADPAFVVYEMASLAADVVYHAVPLSDFRHSLMGLLRAITPATQLVFIANPNNPTGTYVTRAELQSFLREVPKHVIVALDEAYFEYATAPDYPDGLTLRDSHERLVVLRTFSKAYGLAGLRLGYAVTTPELADYLNRVRAPFNADSVAQAAALAALDDPEHLRRVVALNTEQRARVTAGLELLGARVVPSQANFVYAEFDRPGAQIYDRLLRLGVIVRPVPPLPNGLRISIGLPEENTRLLAALGEVLNGAA
jgi:histidinol-phosphate aminotransferase